MLDILIDITLETLIDSLKMLPFLFISYLIIEFIEHRSSKKIQNILSKSGKFGAFIGSLLGCFPQCGFSVTASNLYAGRIITIGTLFSVFIATSDEAIPVLLSNPGNIDLLFKIIFVKLIIAIIVGLLIDFIFRKRHTLKEDEHETEEHIHEMCSHCDCDHGILKSTIKHTIGIFVFILIVSFILNFVITLIGEENLGKLLMSGSILQPVIAGLIGLIPNCASSVLLTQLYLAGTISFGAIIAGLSTGAGIGLVVLFKVNKNVKENLKILGGLYVIGVVAGIIVSLIGI